MTDKPEWAVGNVMFDLSPNVRVNVWIGGDASIDAAALKSACDAVSQWIGGSSDRLKAQLVPPPRQQGQAQQQRPPQNNGGGQQRGGGNGQQRADKYAPAVGYSCDICGGPCGIYPRTGNMRSDKVVCLGRCKDDKFVHTVAWMDDRAVTAGPSNDRDIDPEYLPF